MNAFARKLKQARKASGLRQYEVARALQVDPTTVSNWEHGRRTPSLTHVAMLEAALHVRLPHVHRAES